MTRLDTIEQAIEPPTSFHVNLHAKPDGFIFGPDTRRISGPARMRDTAKHSLIRED